MRDMDGQVCCIGKCSTCQFPYGSSNVAFIGRKTERKEKREGRGIEKEHRGHL